MCVYAVHVYLTSNTHSTKYHCVGVSCVCIVHAKTEPQMLKSCCSSSSASQCAYVFAVRVCVSECVRGRVLAECAAHWARAQLPICRLLIVSPSGPFSPLNASVLLHFNELFSLSSIYNPIFWEILLCIYEMRSNRTRN